MGGYLITEFVEYRITEAMQHYLDAVYEPELPTPVAMMVAPGDLNKGHPVRGILLFSEPTPRFHRLTPEASKKMFCWSDTSVGNATMRESYNMTVIKSKLTRSGVVYDVI
ncbi:hypothetical protein pEaSNUABM9_00015 [Erwinia phage pEa_SNUABM_9]|nr:hypothetical protein pEaSNUABM9_00015 [Erwinia phage pEa_SNUABM_9]